MDPSSEIPPVSVAEWQPIPENGFLETLPPGQYLLHSHFVSDVNTNFVSEASDNQLDMKFCTSVEGSLEQVQQNQLAEAIYEKLRSYNVKVEKLKAKHSLNPYEHHHLRAKLQNINACLLKGFDSFVQVLVDDEVGGDFTGSFECPLSNPSPDSNENTAVADYDEYSDSLSGSNTVELSTEGSDIGSDQSISFSSNCETLFEEAEANTVAELLAVSPPPKYVQLASSPYKVPGCSSVLSDSDGEYGDSAGSANVEQSGCSTKALIREFTIPVCRLEDELPAEKVEKLWRKYNYSKSPIMEKTSSNGKRRYSKVQKRQKRSRRMRISSGSDEEEDPLYEINEEEEIPQKIRLAFQKAKLL